MYRVVLLSGNHLCRNPRVVKEATALAEIGCRVVVLGVCHNHELAAEDATLAEAKGIDFRSVVRRGTATYAANRFVQQLADKTFPQSSWCFGLLPRLMQKNAEALEPGLAIAHSEVSLVVAARMLGRGAKVGVDMEDWYSEDLSLEARKGRPVGLLRRLEKLLLTRGVHSTCTTEVMADALEQEYGGRRPVRIYNVFPTADLAPPTLRDRSLQSASLAGTPSRGPAAISLHWFSQTIGPGRGLELLFDVLHKQGFSGELHLRGEIAGYGPWLREVVHADLRHAVFLHGTVGNDELPSRIAEHDVGFAGEIKSIKSRDLTATNKIFQYLQGGLAVLASDTHGQKEVAAEAKDAVQLFYADDKRSLAEGLRLLTSDRSALDKRKAEAKTAATDKFNWQKEQLRLQVAVRAALGR